MKTSDVGSSLFLMALGGFTAWQSHKLSLGSPLAPEPGSFPFFISLLLIGVAFITLIKGLLRKPGVLPEAELSKGRVILSLVAMFAYPFILEPLGYLFTTFLFMIVLLRIMIKKAWWFILVVASVVSPISYIVFKVFLKVALPGGLMGF